MQNLTKQDHNKLIEASEALVKANKLYLHLLQKYNFPPGVLKRVETYQNVAETSVEVHKVLKKKEFGE